MKNKEVIKNFLSRKNLNKKTANLYIEKDGEKLHLINYSTIIATLNDNNVLAINIAHFSTTTRKIQSELLWQALELEHKFIIKLMDYDLSDKTDVNYINNHNLGRFLPNLGTDLELVINDYIYGINDYVAFCDWNLKKVYVKKIQYKKHFSDELVPCFRYNKQDYFLDSFFREEV